MTSVFSLYSILGVEEDSPNDIVTAAYQKLKANLRLENQQVTDRAKDQRARIVQSIEHAYAILTNNELLAIYKGQRAKGGDGEIRQDCHPRLGQLCVASGMITMDQLREAVQIQIETKEPLGAILQREQFISQAELDGLLIGQQMIDVPCAVSDAIALRLVSLGLLTEDMALVVQLEKKSQGLSIKDLLSRHDWIDQAILTALLD